VSGSVTWSKAMSEILSMPKGDECVSVLEKSVSESKQSVDQSIDAASTSASDQNSAQDSKSTTCTSDDGKSQPEDSMENLYILRFTRCPREFRDALLDGPLLQDCQESMKSIGLQAEMTTGSKIFCKPGLYKNAMEAVKNAFPDMEEQLRPYHVIVTEEFRPTVLKIVDGLPRGFKVKCKEESVIARLSESQWVAAECTWDRMPRNPPKTEEACGEALPRIEEATATTDAGQPSKSRKAKKAKNAKGAAKGKGHLEIGPLFDEATPSFPLMPMDPALALSFTNPMFPGMYPEPNWSSSYLFRQALEEQQAALTNAIAVNLHAQRMMFEGMGHQDEGIRLDRL
jgi:hypothetical protein